MNNLFRNIKFIIIIFTVLNMSNIKAETLEDLSKELNEIRDKISELKTLSCFPNFDNYGWIGFFQSV